MRWLAVMVVVLAGCGEERPEGLVEVFEVDCDTMTDSEVTAPELFDGPVAIAQFETCGGNYDGCVRHGLMTAIDGVPYLPVSSCEGADETRVYVVR